MGDKRLWILLSGLFLALSFYLPVPESMGEKGWTAFALLLFSVMLWATELVPAPVTSLAVVALSSLTGVLPFERAAGHLGNDIIWLIVAMLIMGTAVQRTSLDKRLAYSILHLANGHTDRTVLGVMLIACALTFFIPNAVGRVALLLPIGIGVIRHMGEHGGANFNKAIMLALTFVPYMTTIGVITASSGSIYTAGLFDTMLGYHWNYGHWLLLMMPIVVLALAGLWWMLIRLFPAERRIVEEGARHIREERRRLGPVSPQERILVVLYVLLIVLWLTKPLHGMSLAVSALLVVIVLFLPGVRLMEWKPAMKETDWGIPLVFTAGFVLADALASSGFVAWLSSRATLYLDGLSALALAAAIMLIFVAIRLVFTSLASMAASLMPVALTFAVGTPYNPVWLGMICLTASSIAFLLPTQSVGSLTTYALGYYTGKDMLRAGAILTCIVFAVTLLAAFFYWPLAGLPLHR